MRAERALMPAMNTTAVNPPGDSDDVVQETTTLIAGDVLLYVLLTTLVVAAWAFTRLGLFKAGDDVGYWLPRTRFVAIEIHQGEHELASRNRRLGRFVLGDLDPAPRGRTKVEVSFTLDADGILEVGATEVGTGRAASVQIEASSGLTQDEISQLGDRMHRLARR